MVYDRKRSVRQLCRFVNYGGPYNEPFQDNWEILGPVDMRESWNINTLETIGNIADGCGAFLVPFGLLCKGECTPDEIGTTYIDLLCFDYSNEQLNTPEVVVWNNSDACSLTFSTLPSESVASTVTFRELPAFIESPSPGDEKLTTGKLFCASTEG